MPEHAIHPDSDLPGRLAEWLEKGDGRLDRAAWAMGLEKGELAAWGGAALKPYRNRGGLVLGPHTRKYVDQMIASSVGDEAAAALRRPKRLTPVKRATIEARVAAFLAEQAGNRFVQLEAYADAIAVLDAVRTGAPVQFGVIAAVAGIGKTWLVENVAARKMEYRAVELHARQTNAQLRDSLSSGLRGPCGPLVIDGAHHIRPRQWPVVRAWAEERQESVALVGELGLLRALDPADVAGPAATVASRIVASATIPPRGAEGAAGGLALDDVLRVCQARLGRTPADDVAQAIAALSAGVTARIVRLCDAAADAARVAGADALAVDHVDAAAGQTSAAYPGRPARRRRRAHPQETRAPRARTG